MINKYKLEKHESGIWCITAEDTMYDRPVAVKVYWPITTQDISARFDGADAFACAYNATFDVVAPSIPSGAIGRYAPVTLKGGGRTESIDSRMQDIAPPSTRGKPVRWHNGQWEKLLKKGWVPA